MNFNFHFAFEEVLVVLQVDVFVHSGFELQFIFRPQDWSSVVVPPSVAEVGANRHVHCEPELQRSGLTMDLNPVARCPLCPFFLGGKGVRFAL